MLVKIRIISQPNDWTAFLVRIWSPGTADAIEKMLLMPGSRGPIQIVSAIDILFKRLIIAEHLIVRIGSDFYSGRLQRWSVEHKKWVKVDPTYKALIESFSPPTTIRVWTENITEDKGLTLLVQGHLS